MARDQSEDDRVDLPRADYHTAYGGNYCGTPDRNCDQRTEMGDGGGGGGGGIVGDYCPGLWNLRGRAFSAVGSENAKTGQSMGSPYDWSGLVDS